MAGAYQKKAGSIGNDLMRGVEKQVMLRQLDHHWKEHLAAMDHLRQGIGLRSYAQKNPKQEYKREAFEMFTSLLDKVKYAVIEVVSKVQVRAEEDVDAIEQQRRSRAKMQYEHAQAPSATSGDAADGEGEEEGKQGEHSQPFVRQGQKVGRNAPCPCGSGKKYKQCHGKLA